MTKLSLNKAATYAGKAKVDILKALKSNEPSKKLSGQKNERGHWEIEQSELDRFFGKKEVTPVPTGSKNGLATPVSVSENNALQVEVAMLREQLKSAGIEKGYLEEKINDLSARAERAEAKEDEARKLLTHQTQSTPEPRKRRFFGLLAG